MSHILSQCVLQDITLQFNIDDLPLFHSSSVNAWPILCDSPELNIIPFVVALFVGKRKPSLELLLAEFVTELTSIFVNGFRNVSSRELGNIKVDRRLVENVVAACEKCRSIDPAPIRWETGSLAVDTVWHRLAMDATHFQCKTYLTIIDCGQSKFTIWRLIKSESSGEVTRVLISIFREFGAPREILLDNFLSFRSKQVQDLLDSWKIKAIFRCANRPSGNGVVERVHRIIKRKAARTDGSVADMVYWYNVSPIRGQEMDSIPYFVLFGRLPNISQQMDENASSPNDYHVGEDVYLKPAIPSAHEKWRKGVVTKDGEGVTVEVNNIKRHIADVRKVLPEDRSENFTQQNVSSGKNASHFIAFDVPVEDAVQEATEEHSIADIDNSPIIVNDQPEDPATTQRVRRRPAWIDDYVSGEDIE